MDGAVGGGDLDGIEAGVVGEDVAEHDVADQRLLFGLLGELGVDVSLGVAARHECEQGVEGADGEHQRGEQREHRRGAGRPASLGDRTRRMYRRRRHL